MKYLELYKKWAETGKIEDNPNREGWGEGGLCNTEARNDIKEWFEPEGEISTTNAYWGHSGEDVKLSLRTHTLAYEFTPLRQNMILLLAAKNNEL